jgi:hypothetical protein
LHRSFEEESKTEILGRKKQRKLESYNSESEDEHISLAEIDCIDSQGLEEDQQGNLSDLEIVQAGEIPAFMDSESEHESAPNFSNCGELGDEDDLFKDTDDEDSQNLGSESDASFVENEFSSSEQEGEELEASDKDISEDVVEDSSDFNSIKSRITSTIKILGDFTNLRDQNMYFVVPHFII